MKKMDMEDYKKIIVELLEYVDSFCLENGITYFLNYGSLLGAIRHNGFIPWDDDIDISMPRKDYERFINIFPQNEKRYLLNMFQDDSYYDPYTRICDSRGLLKIRGIENIKNFGPFIDLFPLDSVPNNPEERAKFYKEVSQCYFELRKSMPISTYKTLGFKGLIKFVLFFPKYLRLRRKKTQKRKKELDLLMQKYNSEMTAYLCCLCNAIGDYNLIERYDADKIIRHRFETIEVNIPERYDVVLKTRFGNYLELPPEEDRVTKHHFKPYWR